MASIEQRDLGLLLLGVVSGSEPFHAAPAPKCACVLRSSDARVRGDTANSQANRCLAVREREG